MRIPRTAWHRCPKEWAVPNAVNPTPPCPKTPWRIFLDPDGRYYVERTCPCGYIAWQVIPKNQMRPRIVKRATLKLRGVPLLGADFNGTTLTRDEVRFERRHGWILGWNIGGHEAPPDLSCIQRGHRGWSAVTASGKKLMEWVDAGLTVPSPRRA